ncbi:uncharacterized protein LOC133522638 [Cydia pomonella]|uniref:uncharacterized protein LOC133522638 n=1 Tax=Cydia pomonella TaxID=82600 RepID=UPI002ADE6056|nr:uncharacterized protein LOC133522638 [Cydia pomonella]
MRRTYRSKKDTGGGLDHKDVLLTLDERSSAFEAFYIDKLKQTKRELSCMGSSSQYSTTSQKVRKKKYVKRIVKEVDNTPRKSMSQSTYLTPDKSIKVNRGQDLFDQLLNKSTPRHLEPKVKENDDLFDQVQAPRQTKTYVKKKTRKVNKYNYSSSDSETDKENETSNISTNMTDIGAHKLVVEKEVPSSPMFQDESINKIVQNLSIFNNINNLNSSDSPIISFNKNISRKRTKPSTKQLQSTVLEKSVLSSTPFKNIRTATSIYKLSPISRLNCDTSPNYGTIIEENVVGDDLKSPCSKRPVCNVFNVDKSDVSDISVIENKTEQELNGNKEEEERPRIVENLDCVSVFSDSSNESDMHISLGDSKPSEVFLGFSCINNEVDKLKKLYNDIIDISKLDGNDSMNVNMSISMNDSQLELSLGGSKPSEPFFGFSVCQQNDKTVNSRQTSDKSTGTDESETSVSEDSQDHASLYDTCSSDNEDNNDAESNELVKEPVINLTKINDSVFYEYYDKMTANISNSGNEEVVEQNKSSSSQNHFFSRNNYMDDQSENLDSDDCSNPDQHLMAICDSSNSEVDEDSVSPQETDNESAISMSDDLESNSNDDGEVRCFVNTRRKVTIKNKSNKSSLNDSSSASSECNMTVLSRDKVIVNSPNNIKTDKNELQTEECTEKDINNCHEDEINLDSDEIEETKDVDTSLSNVTTRKSYRKFSVISDSPVEKPVIVLQPGKKWERSLSIYRRMTMLNDHFDRSVLEEEPLNCKGRKYRESVINTMEMQEGSLHNESISSRRSTFVAKPCRSTIVLIKEPNNARASLCNNTTLYDDLKGFLSDDCDDTVVELSKLSIVDSDHEVTVVENLHEDRSTTARDYVLRRCNQTEAILFDECYPDTALKNCHKIGEGVYGEVFLWRARDGRARVMKIVPVAGDIKVNGEHQKDFNEIISEIVIAMELSALRTPIAELERQFDEGKTDIDTLDLHAIQNATDIFNEVLAVRCVYGSYTSRLLDLWELYDECKGSENDNPAILPSDQQYIVLELANAGQDLESYQFNSAEQAHALFLQVAFGLAVGEEAFQFEHRDLHWGNVLIAPTEQKFATFVLRGRAHRVARRGVAATVIDYSLSRLALPLPAPAALYNDLAHDDGLFDAVGDYQFEVYRLMRDKLNNDWKNFEPYTNILWLHYTVDKMITALRYKRTNTKIHKHYISKLKAIKNRILSYGSAVEFVLTDIEY